LLQVDAGNETARRVYLENGFSDIAHRSLWERSGKSIAPRKKPQGIEVHRSHGEEWRQEYALLREIASAGIAWNLPLSERRIRPSWLRRAERFLGEESEAHWLAWQETGCFGALISVSRRWDEQAVLFYRAGNSALVAESLLDRWLCDFAEQRSASLEADSSMPAGAMLGFGFRLTRSLVWMERWLP
jgi:hypothetical protein